MNHEDDDRLLPTKDAAKMLGLRPRTLQDWRLRSPGKLPHVYQGVRAYYRMKVLREYMDKLPRGG